MLRSMTAYASVSNSDVQVAESGLARENEACASASANPGRFKITCELKSVNSRYFDLRCSLPAFLQAYESEIRKIIGAKIKRGKVDCNLQIQEIAAPEDIKFDYGKLEAELAQLQALDNYLATKLPGYRPQPEKYLAFLLKDTSLLSGATYGDDELAEIKSLLVQTLEATLERFIAVREFEGEQLKNDMSARLAALEDIIAVIHDINETAPYRHFEKLRERLHELLQNTKAELDEQKLQTEIALLADKHDVSEELTRLGSHFKQFRNLCMSSEPVGKNLDFLVQEINREINTIGSKANDLNITEQVVILKTELEKIREQVQNVE